MLVIWIVIYEAPTQLEVGPQTSSGQGWGGVRGAGGRASAVAETQEPSSAHKKLRLARAPASLMLHFASHRLVGYRPGY